LLVESKTLRLQDGALKLKDNKFQFVLLDDILVTKHKDCQVLKGECQACHCWALPFGCATVAGEQQSSSASLSLVPVSLQGRDENESIEVLGSGPFAFGGTDCGSVHGEPLEILQEGLGMSLLTLQHIDDDSKKPVGRPPKHPAALTEEDPDTGPDTELDGSDDDDNNVYDIFANPPDDEDEKLLDDDDVSYLATHGQGAAAAKQIQEGLKNDSSGIISRCLRSQNCVSELVTHLQESNSGTAVALTHEELEEEAILLLVKHFQEHGADSKADIEIHGAVGHAKDFEADDAEDFDLSGGSDQNDDGDSDRNSDSDGGAADDGDDGPEFGANDGPAAPLKFPKYLRRWKEAFDLSVEALGERVKRNQHPPGHNDEISLVMSVGNVTNDGGDGAEDAEVPSFFFVKWTNPEICEGRYVRIDNSFRVVYAPGTMFGKKVPAEKFQTRRFACSVNACGAASRRIKGASGTGRDELPRELVRFAQLTGTLVGRLTKDPWPESSSNGLLNSLLNGFEMGIAKEGFRFWFMAYMRVT